MIRMELEEWCEKFLKNIFENSEPARALMLKALQEDWDEDKLNEETLKLLQDVNFKDYAHYRKELADFIEECAADLKK